MTLDCNVLSSTLEMTKPCRTAHAENEPMSEINYFQTYSQRENVVTNNTLLMLRHVQRRSNDMFQTLLSGIVEDIPTIGPHFEQQTRGSDSVPDGSIEQDAFRIAIEAKLDGKLSRSQIEAHVRSLKSKPSVERAYLVGLTKYEENAGRLDEYAKVAHEERIAFVGLTYSSLVALLEDSVRGDSALEEIVADFASFLGAQRLLPTAYRTIMAVPCGRSIRENRRFNVYFEPAERGTNWRRAAFLGIYNDKCVSHVGRIERVLVAKLVEGTVEIDEEESVEGGPEVGLSLEEAKARIAGIVAAATYYPHVDGSRYRYYVVGKFQRTRLVKDSHGGMQRHRFLDVENFVDDKVPNGIDAVEMAALVDGRKFD